MQKHQTEARTFLCDDPENVTITFSPPDPNRQITFGFKSSTVTAMPVQGDQIQIQMGSSMKILFVQFFFPLGSSIPCNINLKGSSGGNFDDPPPINSNTGDGSIRIYTFQ